MDLISLINNLTIINILGIAIVVLLVVTSVVLIIYYKKRLKHLDGLVGIISSDYEQAEKDSEQNRNITDTKNDISPLENIEKM